MEPARDEILPPNHRLAITAARVPGLLGVLLPGGQFEPQSLGVALKGLAWLGPLVENFDWKDLAVVRHF